MNIPIYSLVMCRVTLLFVLFLITSSLGYTRDRPEWDDVGVLQVNREDPRTTMMVFPSLQQARLYDREQSPWFVSLNGQWKFHWVSRPADRPVDFYRADFDVQKWNTIPVPSNWEMEGYGTPVYINHRNPFDISEVRAPYEWNPVGSYRHSFHLPPDWDRRQVFINFDGVSSAFYLWINGEQVGYSQGSRTPAEFDITGFLNEGENQIAVEVYRWSDGAYLENQDFWRLSGIFRDVYLWSTSQWHLRDFDITSSLDDHYRDGVFDLSGEVALYGGIAEAELIVEVRLYDPNGQLVYEQHKTVQAAGDRTPFTLGERRINRPQKWSAETPHLFELYITLRDTGGEVVAVIPRKVGFRRVEIAHSRIRINGQAVRFKGVNRHEHSPHTAHYVTRQEMMEDIILMKKNNFNAVRTSHYPNHPLWYELCDEYGLYVINEANIETHEFGNDPDNLIANHPDWKQAHLDRFKRMVYRDRNHPSVVIWSLGNEAGDGPNIAAVHEWSMENEPTRPFHYERTTLPDGFFNSDFASWMYASPEDCERWTRDQPDIPLILCEYTHAMGNSSGGLDAYWDLIYEDNNFQGAFVWDWVDQGIIQPVPEAYRKRSGRDTFIAYGGWFEDPYAIQHDGNFVMNGLVAADRTPRPGLFALKYYHQYMKVEPVDWSQGVFRIHNRFDFISLNEQLTGRWEILEDGKSIYGGVLHQLDIEPQQAREISLPLSQINFRTDREYHLNFIFANRKQTFYAEPGFEMGWEQFRMPGSEWQKLESTGKDISADSSEMSSRASASSDNRIKEQAARFTSSRLLKISMNPSHLTVAGDDFHVVFDLYRGKMESYVLGGETVITSGPEIDFWRALTDNDSGAIRFGRYIDFLRWRSAHHTIVRRTFLNGEPRTYGHFSNPDEEPVEKAEIVFEMDLPNVAGHVMVAYEIYANGAIEVTTDYHPGHVEGLPDFMPRFGNRMELAAGFNEMKWYGRGPNPTYVDRKVERVGVYRSTVAEEWIDYSRPQENGYKSDVRWVKMTRADGKGLKFTGNPLIGFGAAHYTREDMENSRYSFEMQPRESIFLNIDNKQMGVGGYDTWSSRGFPDVDYRVNNEPIKYRYRIEPIGNLD